MREARTCPFGERIREEREAGGWTQEYFAALGGVSVKSQRNYESGRRAPDAEYLAAIAHAADVQYIVTGERSGHRQSQRSIVNAQVDALTRGERALLEQYRRLPPGGRKHAEAVVAALAATNQEKE